MMSYPTSNGRLESPLSASQLDRVLHGDCLEVLRSLPDASVDAMVTDPPAGISFMGKGWDSDKGGRDAWIAWLADVMRECLRVLKPGGHALVWALPRTSHWTAMALEDAGFEVRDRLAHVFGSGFPKSLDVSKAIDKAAGAQRANVRSRITPHTTAAKGFSNELDERPWMTAARERGYHEHAGPMPATDAARQWDGWGTALKPAVEDWWLVRKPLGEPTVAANVLRYGTGALNIGASRVGSEERTYHGGSKLMEERPWTHQQAQGTRERPVFTAAGRWPANLLLSHSADCDETHGCALWCPVRELDAQSGVSRGHKNTRSDGRIQSSAYAGDGPAFSLGRRDALNSYGDTGGASRYFQQFRPEATFRYVAKASRRERNAGCEGLEAKAAGIKNASGRGFSERDPYADIRMTNHHPTVKPLALMSWLITLITPAGGVVLDPFAGSGSTLVAAKAGGWRYLGIEREAEYVAIAEARLAAVDAPQDTQPVSLGSAVALEPPQMVKPASKPRRKRTPKTQPSTELWQEMRA